MSGLERWTLQRCAGCGRVAMDRAAEEYCPDTERREAQEPFEVVPAERLRGAVEDAEALAHAVSASLTHGEQSPLAAALSAYLRRHPWSDL